MKKRMVAIFLSVVLFMEPVILSAKSTELTKEQKETADKVAEAAMEGWEEYGVLPSVAVAQTFVESSLGKNQVRPNNLWGLRPGGRYSSYKNMDEGIRAYFEVLNNGRYDKALKKKEYRRQMMEILQGGYYGEDDGGTMEEYYQNFVDSIKSYHFDRYDKKMFREIRRQKERERVAKWEKTYTLVYDESVTDNEVKVDDKIIKSGAILIWKDEELQGIYDVVGGQDGRKIGILRPELDGTKVKIIVREEAKG